jgi:hypothetical protein
VPPLLAGCQAIIHTSATERLYHEGERRKKEIELERQQLLEERYKEFTFVPKLGFGGKLKEKDGDESAVPVFDRLASLHSRAFLDEILFKIKSEIELKGCTFQPKILTSRSANESEDEPAYIRLNKLAEVSRAERIRREAEKITDEMASATFSPCLPNNSIQIARRLVMAANGEDDDVYSRLSKHSPKLLNDLGNSFAAEGGLESFSSDSNRSMSRSKCGVLPEQVGRYLKMTNDSSMIVSIMFHALLGGGAHRSEVVFLPHEVIGDELEDQQRRKQRADLREEIEISSGESLGTGVPPAQPDGPF